MLLKNYFRNTIGVANSLDLDPAGYSVGPDLGPNCLQSLSADETKTNQKLKDCFVYNKPIRYSDTRPHRAVGNVSGYRCKSDCRTRGRKFDPSPVPYFRVD